MIHFYVLVLVGVQRARNMAGEVGSVNSMPVTISRQGPENRLTTRGASLTDSPPLESIFMGQQSNKIQKRRRRLAYLERKAAKAKEAAVTKPAKKKAAPKKAPAAAAPAEAAAE